MSRLEKYQANRKKLNGVDSKNIICYGGWGACSKCPYADCDTQRDEMDDMELVICKAPETYNCKTRDVERRKEEPN